MTDDIINILNLNYSDVQSCSSKKDNNCITYFITLIRKDIICPDCASKLKIKDYRNVNLSHQIINGMNTHIIFMNTCKSYHYEANPFVAEKKHTFTDTTSIEIMKFLKEHSATFSMAARHFNTTPTKIVDVFDTFGQMTVCELVDRYLKTKTGVRESTKQGYVTVQRLLAKEKFGSQKIRNVKISDAKLFLIKLQQEDGKGFSTIHNIRGVLRPAFQMAVDDDILVKNPFGFQLQTVLVNDSVTREALSIDQMQKFLKFIHDDVVYCKYYEVVYILFHTGMRISEFCGLTLRDIDIQNKTVNIDHQLQRTADMRYIIVETKTDAGKRKIPITDDVAAMFQAIIEDREAPAVEKIIDGYSGFLFYDKEGKPLVALHWQNRFNNMEKRYNDIYKIQMPNITPHVCRHTYCSNQAKAGMNPKTLQYLMGHLDISVTMNVYTHINFDDAEEELRRMEEFRKAQAEVEKKKLMKAASQVMFKVV